VVDFFSHSKEHFFVNRVFLEEIGDGYLLVLQAVGALDKLVEAAKRIAFGFLHLGRGPPEGLALTLA
jgi:hypothetical protein